MAELIKVTDEDGVELILNLDFVVQMRPGDKADMSVITIVDGKSSYAIYAQGSPLRIATRQRLSASTNGF